MMIYNTILSCISKYIRFSLVMFNKKTYLIFTIFLLSSCGPSSTALLAPAYTFTSTGNILQTGISYSSNEMVTQLTGKTPVENLIEITNNETENDNIMKKTLESDDFIALVEKRVKKTNKILTISNQ